MRQVRLLPATMVSRTTLVLLSGLIISNLVGLMIYTGERNVTLNTVTGEDIAERIAAVARTVSSLPEERRDGFVCDQSGARFVILLTPNPLIGEGRNQNEQVFSILDDLLGQPGPRRLRLDNIGRDGSPENLEAFSQTMSQCASPMGGPMMGMGSSMDMGANMLRMVQGWSESGFLQVAYQLDNGDWLNFLTTPSPASRVWNPRFLLAFLVVTLIVTSLSVWAVRRSTRPLALFARASERLGRDMNAPDMPEDGPREVNLAARAFNDMQKRLRKTISDRTQMLAAVSHDLRTPVTRLRLRAEFIEDEEQREKMLNDLAQMEAMISATLSFSQLDSSDEQLKKLDLAGLVQSVVDDAAELGRKVTYDGPARVSYWGRLLALRRVFDNLVDNAIKYGGQAEVKLVETGSTIKITITDHGPGIPQGEIEKVFDPFYRIETSRSRETGGVGLGLAVVRSIVRGHGGEVALENPKSGGLCVTVTLPHSDQPGGRRL
jgi:signal transduction histidine kinase